MSGPFIPPWAAVELANLALDFDTTSKIAQLIQDVVIRAKRETRTEIADQILTNLLGEDHA